MVQREKVQVESATTATGLTTYPMVRNPTAAHRLLQRTILCRCCTSASPCCARNRSPKSRMSRAKALTSKVLIQVSSVANSSAPPVGGDAVLPTLLGLLLFGLLERHMVYVT